MTHACGEDGVLGKGGMEGFLGADTVLEEDDRRSVLDDGLQMIREGWACIEKGLVTAYDYVDSIVSVRELNRWERVMTDCSGSASRMPLPRHTSDKLRPPHQPTVPLVLGVSGYSPPSNRNPSWSPNFSDFNVNPYAPDANQLRTATQLSLVTCAPWS